MKLIMDERLKHRLVGIAVIFSIGIIFAPVILKKTNQHFNEQDIVSIKLPPKPVLSQIKTPDEKAMFQNIKVAHVEIPTAPNIKTNSIIAMPAVKAISLSALNETKAKPVQVAKNIPIVDTNKTISLPAPNIKIAAVKTPEMLRSKATLNNKEKPPINNYTVQLATFVEQANAIALVSRLKAKGYSASYLKIASSKGVVYKVTVGHLAERQQALTLQKQLANATQLNGFVVSTGIS